MSDIKRMKADIREARERIRQDRIARGVPEEPWEDFVSEAMTTVLIERCKPLFQYVAKYTQLCSEGNQVLPINVEIFDRYTDYLTLINYAKSRQNMFATGMALAKKYMLASDQYPSVSEYVRHLGQALSLAKLGFEITLDHATYNHRLSVEMLNEIRTETKVEYNRLQADEAFFNAEVQRYFKHYATVMHLF